MYIGSNLSGNLPFLAENKKFSNKRAKNLKIYVKILQKKRSFMWTGKEFHMYPLNVFVQETS